MYTIKQAAARSGLSVPTVRVWERRYGVVHPERTASGYRLYDDDAIERLIAMRHWSRRRDATEPGGRADPAAETDWPRWSSGRYARPTARCRDPAATARSAEQPMAQVEAFVAATRRLDVAAMERLLDEAFAAERFESAVEHVVFPALRAVGDGWAEGSIDVAMEHAASETVRRRLARFYDAVASRRRPGRDRRAAARCAPRDRRAGVRGAPPGVDGLAQSCTWEPTARTSWRTAAETTAATRRRRRIRGVASPGDRHEVLGDHASENGWSARHEGPPVDGAADRCCAL